MNLKGRYWTTRYRIENRWHDLRAVLAGYCNNSPWRPIPGTGGGYSHWRCGRRRGHDGMHRAINYVWTDDGRTNYLPSPPGATDERQPWDRHITPTRRQQRA